MFLLVLEIGGGGLLSHKIEDLVAKLCVGVIATTTGPSMKKRLPEPGGFAIIAKIKTALMLSPAENAGRAKMYNCLLYTSDAADE